MINYILILITEENVGAIRFRDSTVANKYASQSLRGEEDERCFGGENKRVDIAIDGGTRSAGKEFRRLASSKNAIAAKKIAVNQIVVLYEESEEVKTS